MIPTDMTLNCLSPWDKEKPHLKQQQYLTINRKSPDITYIDWIGGWGSGKTHTAVLEAFLAFYVWCPGLDGLVTEPTRLKIEDNFLPLWETIVPSELYRINRSKPNIHSKIGPGTIFLRPRHVNNPGRAKEALSGSNVAWAIDDEAGEKCRVEPYNQIDARVRLKTPYRFHSTVSTPALGAYQQIVNRPRHQWIRSTSYDNPHVPEDYAPNLASQLSPQYKALCIDAEFVPLSGLVWPKWSNEDWPDGNMHSHKHDFERDFCLAFDIGVATSAWLILQDIGDLWIVTAEYMPQREGSVETIARQILQDFGTPSIVVVGADVDTRSSTTGRTARLIIRNVFGGDVSVREVKGKLADKEIQHMQLDWAICSSQGKRSFCVSKELISKPSRREHNRGILEVMTQDYFPEEMKGRDNWIAMKNTPLEHCRDAIMYFSVKLGWPPYFRERSA